LEAPDWHANADSTTNLSWQTHGQRISAAGVLIFSGLIAYDTQKIKEQYAEA